MKVSMKRLLVLIAMLCLTLCSVMLITACDNGSDGGDDTEHSHRWDDGEVTTPPTCTEGGVKTFHCLAKDCPTPTRTEPLSKLNHSFSNKYTVEKEATVTEEGWKYQECIKCGARRNEQAIPKLSESGIWYRIKINRWNGYRMMNFPRIEIYNENGDKMHDADFLQLDVAEPGSTATEYFEIEVSLPLGEYKVFVTNIPEGFDLEPYYILKAENGIDSYDSENPETYPELDLRLASHLREGTFNETVAVGEVLPDFSLNTLNKGTVTLSGLLEDYEIVFLHFYYNTCQYCKSEAPHFMEIYEQYKEHIAVICFNTYDSNDAILGNYKSIFGYSDDFYYAPDRNGAWQNRFELTGVPTTIVIDRGGYYAVKLPTMEGRTQALREIAALLPELEEKTVTVSMTMDVILPEKRTYAL